VEPEPQVVSLAGDRAEAGERLRVTLADAEKRLDQMRREFREASGALSVAEKRAEAAKAELQEASRRLERAEERAALTAEDETSARQKAEQAAAARESAEAERDASLRALRAVG
jgi:chromosome segregation ATPase